VPWIVVQTESQREHLARLFIMRLGLETYLPRIKTKLGREALLFPTYVFTRIEDRWYDVAWSPGVLRILMSGDRPAPLPERIIATIRRREFGGFVRLPTTSHRLRRGQPVRITRGSFEGMIGVYDGMNARERERVLLELLGRAVPVEFAPADIAPLDAPKPQFPR
jgi:transcriptional antiterminator RfaH